MQSNEIHIREATTADLAVIQHIHAQAFGTNEEAELVKNLLRDPSAHPVLSLLACTEDTCIGHILYTKLVLEAGSSQTEASLLAPLAILPKYQGKGVGGQLIRKGTELLQQREIPYVLVLGHPTYYPRYGFQPDAARQGFQPPYPIAEEHADAWMVMPLREPKGTDRKYRVRCADALDHAMYWQE